MQKRFPEVFDKEMYCETWYSKSYGADVCVVKPVVQIDGVYIGFQRGSRLNGSDRPSWVFEDSDDTLRLPKSGT